MRRLAVRSSFLVRIGIGIGLPGRKSGGKCRGPSYGRAGKEHVHKHHGTGRNTLRTRLEVIWDITSGAPLVLCCVLCAVGHGMGYENEAEPMRLLSKC